MVWMRTIRTSSVPALVLVVMLAAIVAFVSACSSGGTTGTGTTGTTGGTVIVEKNIAFSPTTLNVKVGDTVTFENQDSVAHHVVVGTTDLGQQQPGQNVTWKADTAGTYEFRCVIHPSMTGRITVGSS
jgi:plastocyanin